MGLDVQTRFDDKNLVDMTINEIIANRADELSDDVAIQYGETDTSVSYRELDQTANSIGNALRQLGIEKGDPVSVMMRDHLETLFVMFGIHKSGGVYCPINWAYKGDTLSYQLDDTSPEVLVIEDQYVDRLNAVLEGLDDQPALVVYETDAESESADSHVASTVSELHTADSTPPDVDLHWDDDLCIIYTSGTTGMPKGVVLPHRYPQGGFTTYYHNFLAQDDVVQCGAPLYHIGALYVLVMPAFIAGARLALWDRPSVSEFWERIDEYGSSFAGIPEPIIAWLLNQPEQEDDHRNTLNKAFLQPLPEQYQTLGDRYGIECMFVGFGQTEAGYPVQGIVAPTDEEHGTPAELRKGYSPAEIQQRAEELGVSFLEEPPGEGYMGKHWRTDHFDLAVLNERDEELGPGEIGELAVRPNRPAVMMQRYINKPDKTVEAWSNLWFHTGDAVYRDEENNFFFVDRIDDVIRRRGENISSIQVQDIVNKHDRINRSAAFPIEDEYGQEDEVAIAVEPIDNADLTEPELSEFFEAELPEFMQPRETMILDELPSTATGKIEKYKLAEQID